MMKTMNVYFYIPKKQSVVLVEVDINNYSSENVKDYISKIMGAQAEPIDAKTYQHLKRKIARSNNHTKIQLEKNGEEEPI